MRPEPDQGRTLAGAPLTGRLRLLRAGGLGGASMLLAAGAHLVGGGLLPGTGVLAITTLLVGLTAVTLTARRCRFWLLATALGVEQLVLHAVFTAGSGSTAVIADPSGHAAMGMIVPAGHVAMDAMSPAMLLGHLVATVVTAWLLARGEGRLWALAQQAVRAATWAPTPRRRRPQPLRPLAVRLIVVGSARSTADPRGPPALPRFA